MLLLLPLHLLLLLLLSDVLLVLLRCRCEYWRKCSSFLIFIQVKLSF